MKENVVIVLAPDSFKESMTAKEAYEAMEKGIKKANKNIICVHVLWLMGEREQCSL